MEYFANEAYVEFVDGKKLEMKELPTNPSDKELQLFLNSTNEASKASNDELWTLQDLKNKFKRPNKKLCHYFLFYYDDKPIGGVMYMDPDDQCRAFSIGDFAIYKEYRGKGFGSKCFKMLLDKIKKSNSILPIYLGVHVNNTKAIELYKKFGFKIAKTLEENGNKFHQMFLGKPIELKSDEKQNGATESLLDHDASNVVESKMYFANNNGKIPKDANSNIVLTKNITDATIYAAFDQFNDSKVAMACKGFVQYKNGTNKHVLVVHGDDSLTEPEEMDCTGTIYSVTLSEPIEFRYHGHRGFGKCQLPKIYTVKEEALKDAQIKKEESVKFKATFEYEKSLTMQHATEDLSQENFGIRDDTFVRDVILPAIKDDTLYHGSSQKLSVIKPFQLKELRDKNVKTISLTPYARLASLFCVPFRSIRENDKGQVIFHHCRIKLDEWFDDMPEDEMYKSVQTVHVSHNIKQLAPIDKTYTGYLHYVHAEDALVDAGANPINGKGPYEVVSYVKELKPYKVETIRIRMVAKYSPSFAKECGLDAEPCEPEDVATESFQLETIEEETPMDIAVEVLQELNTGIEEFDRWIRDLNLKQIKDSMHDSQVDLAFEQIAQEGIIINTVKAIFKKIGEFLAWFWRKLKEFWNYLFSKVQRNIRAFKSARDKINAHKNSNGFFNDGAFKASAAPPNLIESYVLNDYISSGFAPDKFNYIFSEMLEMWLKRPEDLYTELFVNYDANPNVHRWSDLRSVVSFITKGKTYKYPAEFMRTINTTRGSLEDNGYDRDAALLIIDSTANVVEAYSKNSKLIAEKGEVNNLAAKRIMAYEERTDITEQEAVELGKKIQKVAGNLKNMLEGYQQSVAVIVEQALMLEKIYFNYMK